VIDIISAVSADVIYSRKPGTPDIYDVFLTAAGTIRLNAGEKVVAIKRAGGYFEEAGDGAADLRVSDDGVYATSATMLGEGYIIKTGR